MDLNITTAAEDTLIDFCNENGEEDALVAAGVVGAIVVRVTDTIVAKRGVDSDSG